MENNYLQYYLECEAVCEFAEIRGKITSVSETHCQIEGSDAYLDVRMVKLLLRPLSDMSEEEFANVVSLRFFPNDDLFLEEITKIERQAEVKRNVKYGTSIPYVGFKDGKPRLRATLSQDSLNPQQFHYLLSKGFDLFVLIESGQAIDKTKEDK